MVSVRVANSTSIVLGLDSKELKSLRNLLSYTLPSANTHTKYRGYGPKPVNLMTSKGEFPTGLLPRVEAFLSKRQMVYQTLDTRVIPPAVIPFPSIRLSYAPYDEQTAAVAAFVAAGGRGIITAPTGAGKATICALMIDALKVPTLVVVPSLELKKQLTESLASAFGRQNVGEGKVIRVENVDALPPKPMAGYDCVIIDEYHSAASETYRKLNTKAWGGIYYRGGLTATPYRNRKEEFLPLCAILSNIVYSISYETAVAKGFIVPAQVYYYELPKLPIKGNPNNYAAMNSEFIVNRKDRNDLIVDLIISLDNANESTLVLLKEIKHGEILRELLLERGKDIAFANGDNTNNRELLLEFNLKERNTLIATGVLGTGVDTKPCSYVILAGGGKSRPQLIQNIGRALRVFPGKDVGTAIMFLDRSHNWFANHFREVKASLEEEYNIVPVKIDTD